MAADSAKPEQMLELLLPLLLQSALTGKQIDIGQLLSVLATGKPVVMPPATNTVPASGNTVPAPAAPAPTQTAQAPADFITLLLPLLYQRLTGKPWPGTEPKTDAPANPNAPALSRPSVQLSAGALGIVTILQALGAIGMPFNIPVGPTAPTSAGTLSTLIPLITGAIGATGGFGALAGLGSKLLGGLFRAFGK